MGAPEYVPVPPTAKARVYESPDHVPGPWRPDRPGDLSGRQPAGRHLGYQGPDQGYGLVLAHRFRDRLELAPGEHADDAIAGCLGIALRRASLFGRAPVVHDFTLAFTIWGYLDGSPPQDLVTLRKELFEGLGHAVHYFEARDVADRVPEATLRMPHTEAMSAYPSRWAELVG